MPLKFDAIVINIRIVIKYESGHFNRTREGEK